MGSSASVMKSSKLTKPDDCPQENWKQILQLFDKLDSDGTHSIEVEELMGHIAVLHVNNNIKQLNDKKITFANNTEFEKKRIQADLERNIEKLQKEINEKQVELDEITQRITTVKEEYDSTVGSLMLVKKKFNQKRRELKIIQRE